MQLSEIKPQNLYTVSEVVSLNLVSKDTLARWRSEKTQIPYVKCGYNVRYLGQDILDWLEQNRTAPKPA